MAIGASPSLDLDRVRTETAAFIFQSKVILAATLYLIAKTHLSYGDRDQASQSVEHAKYIAWIARRQIGAFRGYFLGNPNAQLARIDEQVAELERIILMKR